MYYCFPGCLVDNVDKRRPVDVEQARSVALQFSEKQSSADQILAYETDVSLVGWRSRYQIGCRFAGCYFYVFNQGDDNGFVVVAGDDVVYPILGYGMQEPFRKDSMPVNLRSWFDSYQRQINWMRGNKTVAGKEITAAWNQLRQGTMQLSSDGVLLTTVLWNG